MDNTIKNLGKRIKEIRNKKGLTQEGLCGSFRSYKELHLSFGGGKEDSGYFNIVTNCGRPRDDDR